MTYAIKIVYPKEEAVEDKKMTERTFHEYIDDVETDEVIQNYKSLLSQGYSIKASFLPPVLSEKGKKLDAFAIAKKFELAGIPYSAVLKLKASGDYEAMSKVATIIEREGFDFEFTVKGKVNENSTIDFAKESTWFDKDFSKFDIKPKIKSSDIADLKSVYDSLVKEKYEVSISLTPKAKKDNDDAFANQLVSYPDETLVIFKLADAEL